MALLTLDVSRFGVVMTADSQPVELVDGGYRVVSAPGQRSRNPILVRQAGGFSGVIGSVGTEALGDKQTRDWLAQFSRINPDRPLNEFAVGLAEALTDEWRERGLRSVLWLFISGIADGEVRFWHVNNTTGLYDEDWSYKAPRQEFTATDDLDGNYIPPDIQRGCGATKEEVLQQRIYSFRNGAALNPAARIFDHFSGIIGEIYAQGVTGFEPVQTIDGLAQFAKLRMEFAKRIYDPKYGVYSGTAAAIAGAVHVYAVTDSGEIRSYGKHVGQVRRVAGAP